ncbi:hypothetical protein Tco_0054842, partial [Tanacetum coccineum]
PTTTIDELTLAQTLIEIKVVKPKAVTIAATTTTRPKDRGVVVQEPKLALRLQAEEQAELEKERVAQEEASREVSSFIPMDSEVVKSSVTRTKRSSKRAGDELDSDKSKKQKIDEHVEAEKDD